MDAQFEWTRRCSLDYDKDGNPGKRSDINLHPLK